jgi:two-component system CheB/CheR fusion protein
MPDPARVLVVVAVTRASAETLASVLERLPAEFPGCGLVIALDDDPAELAARLAARTPLNIVAAESAAAQPCAGRFVVVTPGAASDLASAAAAFAGRVMVLLLRDGGTFAERELDAIRAAGGLIVHEVAPRGARALPARPSDVGAPAAELAGTIEDLIAERPEIAESRMLHLLLGELREAAGIDFREYKAPTIVRRLARLMESGGFPSVAEYVAYLRRRPEAYASLVGALLINVTEFFRDPPLFEYLRDEVFPDLIAYASANENELRLWSAGCATGEEAYSLAMLVAEALGPRLSEFHVRIFATDLDEDAIAFARHGAYPRGAFDGLPPDYMTRYFTETSEGYEVKKHIRALTVFGQHDLAQRAPFPRIDLCLCRNVLIYFSKELQQRALQLFAFSLRNDGYLVLGKAETTSPLPEYFRPVDRALKIYRRHGPHVLLPPGRIRDGTPGPRERITADPRSVSRLLAGMPNARVSPPFRERAENERLTQIERVAQLLLDSPIGLAVIDRRYDVVVINQTARTFLNVHGSGVGEDLLHSASGIASDELRAMVDAVFGGEAPAPREFEVRDALSDVTRTVLVTCLAQRDEAEQTPNVAIMLVDVTAETGRRRDAERANDELRRRLDEAGAKLDQLMTRQRALLSSNDELTGANVELRSNNEHLLIAAEEAASAAEEIETLNEEMQATNEELETLNEELQATVEELNTTNDELEARGSEFQDLAASRERQRVDAAHERDRLRVALDTLHVAFAVFGENGTVVYENPAYRRLISLKSAVFAGAGGPLLDGDDPLVRASRGETFRERYLLRSNGKATAVSVRALAYQDDGAGRGVVLTVEPDGVA